MSVLSHATIVRSVIWHSEEETRACAARLAAALLTLPHAGNALIALGGDLGAGKTTLVRHLLRTLGVQGRIKSPTYGLVETYEVTTERGLLPIWHMDFYRLNDPSEWEHAGLRDVFATPGLKLVEWPERAGSRLPQADLMLHIRSQAGTDDPTAALREVQIQTPSPTGRALAEALR